MLRRVRSRLLVIALGFAVIVATLFLPAPGKVIMGGGATLLSLPAEPGASEPPRYLVLSARLRPRFLGEALVGRQSDVALRVTAPLEPGAMDTSKVFAWSAALAAVGNPFVVAYVDPSMSIGLSGLQAGDVLADADGHLFDLETVAGRLATHATVRVRVLRQGVPFDVEITADDPIDPLNGLVLEGKPASVLPPPGYTGAHASAWLDVAPDLGTKDVHGPSAGLLLGLANIDELTSGDLSGGLTIAATGEITPNGDILGVGGLEEKIPAAVRRGANVIFVPANDADRVRGYAPSTVRVIGVTTLIEAVWELCALGGTSSLCGNVPAAD